MKYYLLLLIVITITTFSSASAVSQITIDESAGQTEAPFTVRDNSGNVLFRIISDGQTIINEFIQFSGSGLTSLRTYIFPDSSGTVVLEDTSQTLTSKTIDADSNTISNIEDADIKAGANIALSKLDTDPLARAGHTGTQTASTISDFDTQVQLSRLDQMASPTSDVSMNNLKITNLAAPTSPADAVTKSYADSVAQGLDIKQAVRVATTGPGILATDFESTDTIDGVVLAIGDRILIKDQVLAQENGIYTVNLSGAPSRSTDADTSAEVTSGMFCFVKEGTVNAILGFALVTDDPITLDTTPLVFSQFTGVATGEINTASNTLSDNAKRFGLSNAKSGIDLPFKVLKEGANIDLTSDGNKVMINVTGAELAANKNAANGYAGLTGGLLDKLQTPLDTVFTNDAQTLTSKTIDADLNTISNIENGDIKAAAAIDASKIADGSVSSPEFQYLGDVTSLIQAQLNGKASSFHSHVATDIGNGDVDDTELSFVDGVTSAIQTQLDSKESTTNKNAASGYAGLDAGSRIAKSNQHSETVYLNDVQTLTGKTLSNPQIDGLDIAISTKTGAYTLTSADDVILVDATGGPITITLPTSVGLAGKVFVVKKIDNSLNLITIVTTSSQTIDSSLTVSLSNNNSQIILQSDGANWKKLDSYSNGLLSFRSKGTTLNRWFGTAVTQGASNTIATTANVLRAFPFIVPNSITIDRIQFEVTTAGAGSSCRLGIYTDNGNTYPASLVATSDVGVLSGASTGVKTNTFGSPITLAGNSLYWLSYDCSPTAPTVRAVNGRSVPNVLGYASTMGGSQAGTGWTVPQAFGVLPANYPAGGTVITTTPPMILVRIIG